MAGIEGGTKISRGFLRAGAARVVVPARPSFAAQANLYAESGVLWGGGQPPGPGDPNDLSVADEIKARKQRPDDGVQVDPAEITIPLRHRGAQVTGSPPMLDATLPKNTTPNFLPPT